MAGRRHIPLGVVAFQCFNHKRLLQQGALLLAFWPPESQTNLPFTTNESNVHSKDSILIQINLPEFDQEINFPDIKPSNSLPKQDFTLLPKNEQNKIHQILAKDSTIRLSREEKLFMWTKRYYLAPGGGGAPPDGDCSTPSTATPTSSFCGAALARILESVPSYASRALPEIYALLSDWSATSSDTRGPRSATYTPLQAIRLLLPNYPDLKVREFAINELRHLSDSELLDFLTYFVQAVKFESYHLSALIEFLLDRALRNPRIAHKLYWIIKEAANDEHHRRRYELFCGAFLSVAGEKLVDKLRQEEHLATSMSLLADRVKSAKDKEVVLQSSLTNINEEMFSSSSSKQLQLPINPAMSFVAFNKKCCSFFASNAFPLKLVLKNSDSTAESIMVMFKSGDDLRQDMLTMQLIRIMDRLWLAAGIDLVLVTFACQVTASLEGMIELVEDSETLRRIQTKQGLQVHGSFRDKSIAEWLRLHNTTDSEYEKCVDNFTVSCAGYCVATYVLGICDRHNDNIMIKQSGHLFHIDFGKFLGDSQMFGTFKRDRVPFVLTSDMAYVINSGDKPTRRFQKFIDVCCRALNVLRANSDLLLNLFSLLVNSNIPGVNQHAVTYIQKALMTNLSDKEVTCAFSRLIAESLLSKFTKVNFFIHNMAQIKFSGHTEGTLLSFIQKTYSLNIDGQIEKVEIFGYQKRYDNNGKYFVFIIRVHRCHSSAPGFVFRRYSEIQEFHAKLCAAFPLASFSALTNSGFPNRNNGKPKAEQKKSILQRFLDELFSLAPEISEHDLVYSFFHVLPRDQQDIDQLHDKEKDAKALPKPVCTPPGVKASVKMSIYWNKHRLNIMVMHVKDLNSNVTPNPYVKIYLLPDVGKVSKRKTKVVYNSCFPTFNEILHYNLPVSELKMRHLQVSVWNCDTLQENVCLGMQLINLQETGVLDENNENREVTSWFSLEDRSHALSV